MASVLLVCLASYLLGSIPNGLVFGKLLWHVDLREYGSHNIGATNAWRTLGKGPGFLIFLLDFLKGALSVGLAEVFTASPLIMVIAGILAIVGHSCSLFLHFKGGKGVATNGGVAFGLGWPLGVTYALVWVGVLALTRISSLAGMSAVVAAAIAAWVMGSTTYAITLALIGLFVIWLHRENIRRLIAGTEPRVGGNKA